MIRVAMPVLKDTYTIIDDRQYCYIYIGGTVYTQSLPLPASFSLYHPQNSDAEYYIRISRSGNIYTASSVLHYYSGNYVREFDKKIFFSTPSHADSLVSGSLELPSDSCVISISYNGNDVKTVKSNQNNGGYIWGKPYKFTPTLTGDCLVSWNGDDNDHPRVWPFRYGDVVVEPALNNPNNTYFTNIINSMLNITYDNSKIFHGEKYLPYEIIFSDGKPANMGVPIGDVFGPVSGPVSGTYSACLGYGWMSQVTLKNPPILAPQGWSYVDIYNPNDETLYAHVECINTYYGTTLDTDDIMVKSRQHAQGTWVMGDKFSVYFTYPNEKKPVSTTAYLTRE